MTRRPWPSCPGRNRKRAPNCGPTWRGVEAANAPPSLAGSGSNCPGPQSTPQGQPATGRPAREIGLGLLEQKKWTEAEPLLRECLDIREKTQPDVWTTFNTKSLLGGALLGQKKYAEAEPLLMAATRG